MTPGACVGLIGALAAYPRRQLARAVEAAGGRLQRGTSRRTTHAVFGRTLLLRRDEREVAARSTAERAAGRRLLSENGFLRGLGLLAAAETGQLSRSSLVEQSGLPGPDLDLLALFDAFEHDCEPFSFRDLILARKYAGLVAGGAGWGAIVRSVHRAGSPVSLTARALQVGDGRAIHAKVGDRLSELDGQMLLDLGPEPQDADALFAAAEAAEDAGDRNAAASLYARCLALDPGDAIAAFNRANCLAGEGRAAEAEAEYHRALRSDPGFAEAFFNLACLLAAHGRTGAARRHLQRAVAADPDYADAIYNLAAHAFDAGDLECARRWWTRYLELDSRSDWARTAARGLKLIAIRSASAG